LKILWIGKHANDEIFKEMAKKGYKDPAAQLSQDNLISALDRMGIAVDTINAFNVPSDYYDIYVMPQKWSRTGSSTDVSVGYTNIKYFSHVLITKALRKEIKVWAQKNNDEKVIIIVYGMQSSLMSAAILAKKLIPNSKVIQIVPDLPQHMDTNMSFIKKVLKEIDWIGIKSLMNSIDGFVLYTKHMANFLGLAPSEWMLMEGSINQDDIKNYKSKEKNLERTIVMYSGKIDKKFGVIELLEATKLISEPNFEFWFTGHGNAIDILENYIKYDSRIKYLGFLPTRDDLLEKQSEATMLMNMRLPTEYGSSYCFPSKIFEYMASGTPVLSFKVDGIPDEYYEYLIEMKSTNPMDIAEKIKETGRLSPEERRNIGQKSKEFVREKKNSFVQANKVLDFISKFS